VCTQNKFLFILRVKLNKIRFNITDGGWRRRKRDKKWRDGEDKEERERETAGVLSLNRGWQIFTYTNTLG
jgi:hypothetical protein